MVAANQLFSVSHSPRSAGDKGVREARTAFVAEVGARASGHGSRLRPAATADRGADAPQGAALGGVSQGGCDNAGERDWPGKEGHGRHSLGLWLQPKAR